ncbi:hypothetical protein CPB83DRAFT_774637 [Crepidotus variabilis]|uniref:Alpha-type protein kinase domain-containing protein n=1 Tax=Crepidotus variabilis TaxID=179855 RepID=A0A9P6E7K1_9AGAR|nr:hypothetical protein CPB83DRAFT_774637 [Crepidotus variabilis]
MGPDSAKGALYAEYALLKVASVFKTKFDNYAEESGVTTMPAFKFNFEGSILGCLIASAGGGRSLPYYHFIATPLLPCGQYDSPVKKYTGNGEVGPANNDMTKAIHAFAHFSAIYSQKMIVFCDLQGELQKVTLLRPVN